MTGREPTPGATPAAAADAAGRFAGHGRLHGHHPEQGADTAGTAWEGRTITGSPFSTDSGEPDAAVRAAMARLHEAPREQTAARETDLLAALGAARLFAVVQAVPTEVEEAGQSGGLARDVRSDMASPVLSAPDGRRGMPLFTGLDTLSAWRADARPVPVAAADAARAAIEDSCDVVLLDIGTRAGQVLRLSHVWALAQERPWRPAHDDEVVRAALARAIAGRPDIVSASLGDGSVHAPGVTRVVLTLRPGLAPEQVRALTESIGESLAADPDVRIRVDDLAMVLRQADDQADGQ